MKRFYSVTILAFFIILSCYSPVVSNAESTILSDDIFNTLTEKDFVHAYNISQGDDSFQTLSEENKNNYIINIFNDIYKSKRRQAKGSPLPTASNLNAAERQLVRSHPAEAVLVYTASNLATNKANSLYSGGTLHNGNGDAFRHTYWNTEMVTMLAGYGANFNLSNGKARAKVWADAHEQNASQPALEKTMDLHNNNVGRVLVTSKMSSATLVSKALAKVNNGSCRRIVNGSLVKTTSSR